MNIRNVPTSKLVYHSTTPKRHFSWRDELFFSIFDLDLLEKESNCCICLNEDDKDTQFYFVLSCGHVFHSNCSVQWFCSQEDDKCPLCRQVVNIEPRFNKIISKLIGTPSVSLFPTKRILSSKAKHGCAICNIKEQQMDEPWIRLKCGHEYHIFCFSRWCDVRYNCPLCNRVPQYDI